MAYREVSSGRAVGMLLLSLALLLSGCGNGPGRVVNEQAGEDVQPVEEHDDGFGPGLYMVNEELKPGRYRVESGITYYARLRGLDGSMARHGTGANVEAIIANGNYAGGPIIVDIKPTDLAFETIGPGRWRPVDETYRPHPRTRFGDGHWLVGLDIEPGTYRTEDEVWAWQRVSGFSQEPGDYLEGDVLTRGEVVVEIKPEDVGFQTSGGASWEKID